MENKKSFGTFICQRRKELGMTQKEFAQRLFVTDSAVSKWERGLAYPDITLLQSICQVLQCSEKELLSSSEDTEGRRAEQLAKKYLQLTRNYRLGQYILYGLITLGCLLGNLLSQHALTWFWIVLASELMVASLTLLPTFVPEGRRGLASLGGFTGCLLLLLLVCCLYTGGDWFLIAGVSVLFGMGLVFLPFALRALPLPEELAHRKVSLYVGIELLLLLALFGVACLYTGGTWFLSAALWTVFGLGIALLPLLLRQLPCPGTGPGTRRWSICPLSPFSCWRVWPGRDAPGTFPCPCCPLPCCVWPFPGAGWAPWRYLPLGRWFRAGVGLAWTGLWIWLAPFVLDQIYLHMGYFTSTPYQLILPIDFHNWAAAMSANVMFLIILGFLLLGLLCVVAGILWRRTHPRPPPLRRNRSETTGPAAPEWSP